MGFLPTETFIQIFSFLDGNDLVSCAQHRLAQFRQYYIPGGYIHGRCFFLRKIEFVVLLPEYDSTARAVYETEATQAQNNEIFTKAVSSLWQILAQWPTIEYRAVLSLSSESPSDFHAQNRDQQLDRLLMNQRFPEQDLLDGRYDHSFLGLTKDPDIPLVAFIAELLWVDSPSSRHVSPAAFSTLVSRLPRLQSLEATFRDTQEDEGTRIRLRNEFATTIANWPKSLKRLKLVYHAHCPDDETATPQQLSVRGMDPLNRALNKISKQLETIELDGLMISPELFGTSSEAEDGAYWPKLVHVSFSFPKATPSGQWLFERDVTWIGASAEQKIYKFRTLPNPNLTEIYVAAGEAAQQMPYLRSMRLVSSMAHADWVDAGDIPQHWFFYQPEAKKVSWVGTSTFNLSEEVQMAWEAAGKTHGAEGLTIENCKFSRNAPGPFEVF
ncbi:hypothetical protein PENFLA_c014G00180 [Penicillium flavigenum]|uniref:DUF6546 domain-containing protein n=1 Tax=Penicillium flavigenum TaxID=254877 RepID=A0A1V6T5U9_9EURO|nr:hypothetical protein PENFLA_c014G00180 [Penicillium flavigenum]